MSLADSNTRPPFDPLLVQIADYVCRYPLSSDEARETARLCLMDALGCGILALSDPACQQRLGPVVPGAELDNGVPVPGTRHRLEPVQAAFNIGTMIRWLDYNDTWLAAEWGHPSDNLGALLACGDYINRRGGSLTVADIITAQIKAYEIQGVLALENSFNRQGLDHVLLVRIASTALATALLGGDQEQVINALSNAWLDGGALRTYRHAPNTGWRKSWAAGDATSRAVRLALMALQGEMGYPSALSAPQWGFQEVLFDGQPLTLGQPLGSYVMENILFKVAYPAEFHAQTALECAIALHPQVGARLEEIDRIELHTQEAAVRIINKSGPLHNHADRDHSLQYITAVGLIFGELESRHYSDQTAADPRIDALRDKMQVSEDPTYSRDYLDPAKRSIANRVVIHLKDGTILEEAVEYPIGHRRRRAEALPLLTEKFSHNLSTLYPDEQSRALTELMQDQERLFAMPVDQFMDLWIK